jgi:Icc-related predicted phosphoesterase
MHHECLIPSNGAKTPFGWSRRKFLGSTIAGSLMLRSTAEANDAGFEALRDELIRQLDATTQPPGATVAILSDLHIFLGNQYPRLTTESFDDQIVAEINGLQPVISHLVMAGDLISYHSMTPGSPRFPLAYAWALEEFRIAREQIRRFEMPVWMVPGNHDTDAFEVDAELFRSELGVPAYQRIEIAGVPVFLLNTGNGGMLGPAQREWLLEQAATVPRDQEVLIVQHIPTFDLVYSQAGSKRIIAEAFADRSAPVFIVSGHHHSFSDRVYSANGTTFVQMQTTTANPRMFSDGRSPGYVLLHLREGRVMKRIQRSLVVWGFRPLPDIGSMTPAPVTYPFDGAQGKIATYEEGFYARAGVMEHSGVDVGCFIANCKTMTLRLRPGDYRARITRLVIAGEITPPNQPRCWVSTSADSNTWMEVPFSAARGVGLHEADLSGVLDADDEYLIKLDTGLEDDFAGFTCSGWALAAAPGGMTGYEEWLYRIYGTLERRPENSPDAIAKGGSHPNVLTYAFNLDPWKTGSLSGLPTIQVEGDTLGRPTAVTINHVRVADPASGLEYVIESSADLQEWHELAVSTLHQTIIATDSGYEQVGIRFAPPTAGEHRFFRLNVRHTGSAEGVAGPVKLED